MGKPSIIYQVLTRLDSLEAYGWSKRATREGLADATGGEYRTTRSPFIHSRETKETYTKHCVKMAEWVRDTFGIKDLSRVTFEHVRAWLESRQRNGDTPSSLKTYGSAVAKLFGVDYNAFGFAFPPVRLDEIKRGRLVTRENTIYGENHPEFRDFVRAVGPRKHRELENLTLENFRWLPDGSGYLWWQGKGGKWRATVPLQTDWAQRAFRWAYEKALAAGPGVRIFPRCDHSYNIHRERAYYAKSRYFELADVAARDRKDLWVRRDGEVLDKIALHEVSVSIGHERIEVVRYNYWYAF